MLRRTELAILLLLPLYCGAQYIDLSGDINKGLGIIDNPGNQVDYTGVDLDLEAGALMANFSGFLYYGRFDAGKYHNYGLGVDYYLAKGDWYDIAVGGGYGFVMRDRGPDTVSLAGYLAWMTRLSGVFWIYPKIGISGRIGYQERPDTNLHGIAEASIGVRVKLKDYWNGKMPSL